LSNGNYVVSSPSWDNGGTADAGAATWGNGSSGTSGTISSSNSLVGSSASDVVGAASAVALSNGNYVVASPNWDNGGTANVGAATWGNGAGGTSGTVSSGNSLVGSSPDDFVSSSSSEVVALSNGNYVVASPYWDNGSLVNVGAVTWGNGSNGTSGLVSSSNSLVGSTTTDQIGVDGVVALSNGNYVVVSPNWDTGGFVNAGAATWGNGVTGQTLDGSSTITPHNSLVGQNASANLAVTIDDPSAQVFLARFARESGGRIAAGLADPALLTFTRAQAQSMAITPAFLARTLNTGTAVILQASNDLTLSDPLTVNNPNGAGGALTLQAGRSILIDANITTDDGALTLIANERLADGVVSTQRDAGAAVIAMAAGSSISAGHGSVTIALRDGAGKTNRTSGAITLTTIAAARLSATNSGPTAGSDVLLDHLTLTDSASINATGAIEELGSDAAADLTVPTLTLGAGSGIGAGGQIELDATTLTSVMVSGAGAINLRDTAGGLTVGSATFGGSGTVDAGPNPLTISNVLAVGTNLVTLHGSTVTLAGSSTLQVTINGSGAGQFGQIKIIGGLALANAALALSGGAGVPVGTSLVLLANDGSDAVSGTFGGLPTGSVISIGTSVFLVSYTGGDGNDVVLTRAARLFLPYVRRS
ncbi:MAG: hypothetical protein ACJ8CR_01065, partial [Roseiflexaceae bacterium]